MGIFKSIGRFAREKIARPIDRAVIKPIDKAVLQPLRMVTDKDVALKDDRRALQQASDGYEGARVALVAEQVAYETARIEYERITEIFRDHPGAAPPRRLDIADPDWDAAPETGIGKVGQAAEDGARFVLKTLTLNLTEAAWNVRDVPAERKYLERETRCAQDATRRLRAAGGTLSRARQALERETAAARQRLAALGAEASASDLRVAQASDAARLRIVARLLTEGHDAAAIARITGFTPALIARAAAPQEAPPHKTGKLGEPA
ncbi:hypothetical protein [Poseidonocella sedimentorum]|uniref:Uncharacterized protein n=1 Tax=Poseidonocella sedimentorum TaxID=871652 RepID=A0A1I6EDW0_9RHOB|nr:hypothetical protein [Poseidonocella sedimentorum]SFR15708.1 hypothetical protein SAMN04515673_11036 [Poseidonocella sedimentorum]